MLSEQTTEALGAIASASKATGYAGAGTAVFAGLTQPQWAVVGVIGGLMLGVISLAINVAITIYFKHQHLKIARGHVVPEDAP